jgi:hypothetical protein
MLRNNHENITMSINKGKRVPSTGINIKKIFFTLTFQLQNIKIMTKNIAIKTYNFTKLNILVWLEINKIVFENSKIQSILYKNTCWSGWVCVVYWIPVLIIVLVVWSF